ncbi:MAG: hypothetical protein MRY79_08105 [Alphaproteobacteria bacterium]|nr:hypothetical protein [Alphaproteobacteria bacterium]
MTHSLQPNPERGNVFFYILLAIVLVAALTYAVTRGNRGNVDVFTDQQAKLAAQEIIEYGNTIAAAVQKLRLRGCADTEISFENDIYAGYTNSNAPADKSCHVFDLNGGALEYTKSPEPYFFPANPSWRQSYGFMTGSEWDGNGSTCADASCSDIIMILLPLDKKLCDQLNKLIGFSTPPSQTINGAPFVGTHAYSSTINNAAITSKTSACVHMGGDSYAFIRLILAR